IANGQYNNNRKNLIKYFLILVIKNNHRLFTIGGKIIHPITMRNSLNLSGLCPIKGDIIQAKIKNIIQQI
ncbi:hypothetical protein, partial [Campylobacter coli]|uniref:hypothetical protein n=1 Tax=Campylobacter coli TaxID=195 RepID=UPI001C567D5C